MTSDEAFNRRFYADRAELASLGIDLKVEKQSEGSFEAETYTLPPENFYLPAIEFSDSELAALRTALTLLDGEFAYAEPLRLALQQLSWGKPSPLSAPEQRSVRLAMTASSGGRDLSQRLSKIETAIFRRKTITFDYYTMGRDAEEPRKVDPYHLLFRGGLFYLVGYAHERKSVRVFRLSRIRGKVGYSSKAEHDFQRPEDFDPRTYATRADWQLGDQRGEARIWLSERIEWLVRRHLGGDAGTVEETDDGAVFTTPYGDSRQLISWVLGLGPRARILEPQELVDEADERIQLVIERHAQPIELAAPVTAPRARRAGGRRQAREPHPARALRSAGHAGGDPDRGRPGRRQARAARAHRGAADLGHRAAPGHRRAQRRELRRRQLRALRRGAGRHGRGGSRALRRQLRAPGSAAAAGGQGARGGHRPGGRAPARGLAVHGPREDRGGPGPRPGHRRPPDHHRQGRRLGDRPGGVQRDLLPPAARDRALQGGPGRVHGPDDRALPAAQRHRGLVRARVRAGQGGHALVPAGPHPLGHGAEAEVRAARGHRARRRRAGPPRARCPPRSGRGCGSHPSGRAGRARTAAWWRSLPMAR